MKRKDTPTGKKLILGYWLTSAGIEIWEEKAAVLEHCAGYKREEAEELAMEMVKKVRVNGERAIWPKEAKQRGLF